METQQTADTRTVKVTTSATTTHCAHGNEPFQGLDKEVTETSAFREALQEAVLRGHPQHAK